jgi:hypothetical protein
VGRVVIYAVLACLGVQAGFAQAARKTKETKGPRALGLLEISSDGNARLVPIAIMVDGKFYDASAYKASPVPLALWSETVYEAEKTGVPQGLFTVGEAMRTGPSVWFGQGKWRPAGSEPKAHHADAKPKLDEDEGPPKLRRSDPGKTDSSGKQSPPAGTPSADEKKNPTSTGTDTPSKAPTPSSTPSPSTSTAPVGSSNDSSAGDKAQEAPAASDANDDDPNRPILKRGKPETEIAAHPQVGASTGVIRRPVGDVKKADEKRDSTQAIPAISDAGGPDPRPYSYDIKPDEEQKYRKGMLALASDALLARIKETTPSVPGTKPAARTPAARKPARGPQPIFDDVQFRTFDLWNTNEPVFILSATAHMPDAAAGSPNPVQQYYITLVAKKNIYDELRKLYAGVTDAGHLDQTPRLELIDAVDADGDGRGELLFRRISNAGNAWGVYRAGADQLFPLFEGSPPGQ